jgi:predicted phosphoribosyltransferase
MIFRDRLEAGKRLASHLMRYAGRDDVVVVALPRGGVPVGFEVAKALGAPLDVFIVRKLGLPGNREFAMGAVASGGIRFINPDTISRLGVPVAAVERVVEREERELRRREREYRPDVPPVELKGKTVIVVDDGVATGASMLVALEAIRRRGAGRIVAAFPIGSREAVEGLSAIADEVACVETPRPFLAVGRFYQDFGQVEDAEVVAFMRVARAGRQPAALVS